MARNAELDLVLTSALRVARTVKDRARRASQANYASETPKLLAELIFRTADFLEDRLLRLGSEPSIPANLKYAQLSFHCLASVHSHLRFVETAAVRATPWSLVRPFEDLARGLHGDAAAFVLRPRWGYNYSIGEVVGQYRGVLEGLATDAELASVLKGIPKHLYVTSFAGVERLHVLLHVLLGHEIAHPIERAYFKKPTRRLARIPRILRKLGTSYHEMAQLARGELDELLRKVYAIDAVFCDALGELMCDHACVILFGPAALFAMEEFGRRSDLDKFTIEDHHPPWRYRLRAALAALPWEGVETYLALCGLNKRWCDSVRRRYNRIDRLAKVGTDERKLDCDDGTSIAYALVRESKVRAYQHIEKKLAKSFTLDNLPHEGMKQLIDRLRNGVLPNEYWRDIPSGGSPDGVGCWSSKEPVAADLRAIIVSAALYRTHFLPSAFCFGKDGNAVGEFYDRCHCADRLVLRAIECAHLQRRYEPYNKAVAWES